MNTAIQTRVAAVFGCITVCLSLYGCGGGNSTPLPDPSNPVPTITSLAPSSATPGTTALTMTVNGSDFARGATVRWNGSDRPTSFVSATQVTAQLTASDLATAGTAAISVSNPQPGGGASGSLTFAIEPDGVALYRVAELVLKGQNTYSNPFADTTLTARFDGPGGQSLTITGFYDGDGVWRIRFAPLATGTWHYQTTATNTSDKGLNGISGSLEVGPASSTNPLYQHGGFLRVSENHRYLTYTDGTPFFWLGDVWWFAPSSLLHIDGDNPAFKTLVDKRSSQNYSVLQWAFLDQGWGHEWCCGDLSTKTLVQQQRFDPAYWQLVDRYFAYAQDHGLLPVFGFGWARYENLTQDQWKFLWSYVMARYAATPVSFLVTMEYNVNNDPQLIDSALDLGKYIKDSDPYRRAMSVHAWAIQVEGRQAWTEPWYDFIMVQGGHWSPPMLSPASFYNSAYDFLPAKPMVDTESEFEGILGYGGSPNEVVGPEQTRRGAYYSIQLGGFGFTYGAHGLWYPTQSDTDDKYWAEWGQSSPWWVALNFPAGQQMQYLRALYESVNWWELEPLPDGMVRTDGTAVEDWYQPRAKAKGDEVYLIWFPYGSDGNAAYTLRRQASSSRTFNAKWFDPQTGLFATALPVSCAATECAVPARPDNADWVLVLE